MFVCRFLMNKLVNHSLALWIVSRAKKDSLFLKHAETPLYAPQAAFKPQGLINPISTFEAFWRLLGVK